eukprot:scaffold284979_cov28-Tisochrysis_lutea.AAC.2
MVPYSLDQSACSKQRWPRRRQDGVASPRGHPSRRVPRTDSERHPHEARVHEQSRLLGPNRASQARMARPAQKPPRQMRRKVPLARRRQVLRHRRVVIDRGWMTAAASAREARAVVYNRLRVEVVGGAVGAARRSADASKVHSVQRGTAPPSRVDRGGRIVIHRGGVHAAFNNDDAIGGVRCGGGVRAGGGGVVADSHVPHA